jgi:hypothetical protein
MSNNNNEILEIRKILKLRKPYTGKDIALDSCDVRHKFPCKSVEEIKEAFIKVLETEYNDKLTFKYEYDAYGDSKGACCHHIMTREK